MFKKLRIAIFVILLLLTAAVIAAVVYFVLKDHKETAKIEDAKVYYKSRDYKRAKEVLINILRRDRSNELAFRMLADILESEYDLKGAAYCYSQAVSLAPLDKDLRIQYSNLLSLMGNYPLVVTNLKMYFENKSLAVEPLTLFLEAAIFEKMRIDFNTEISKVGEYSPALGLYLSGVQALSEKKLKSALGIFMKINDNDLNAYLRYKLITYIASINFSLGNYEEAEKYYLIFAKAAPELGAYQLADFYVSRDRLKDAIVWFEKAHEINPADGSTVTALAEAYASTNQPDKVNALLTGFTPRTKTDIELVNYLRAIAKFQSGSFVDAGKLLDVCPTMSNRRVYKLIRFYAALSGRKLDQLPGCVEELKKAVDTDESNQRLTVALRGLLLDYYKQNNVADAGKVANAMLIVADKPGQDRLFALNVALISASKSRDYAKMELLASRILKESPENMLATLAMGDAMQAKGQIKESLVFFNKLPKDDSGALMGRAVSYQSLGRNEEAGKCFRQVWEQHPGDPVVFQYYADFLMDQKQYDEVVKLFGSLKDTPENDYLKSYLNGRIAEIKGNKEVMLKEYGRSIDYLKKMPPDKANRYRLAYLLAVCDRNQEASAVYHELLKESPEWVMVIINLSEIEASLGNTREGLLLAEKAFRLAPKDPNVKTCLERRKKENEAAAAKSKEPAAK